MGTTTSASEATTAAAAVTATSGWVRVRHSFTRGAGWTLHKSLTKLPVFTFVFLLYVVFILSFKNIRYEYNVGGFAFVPAEFLLLVAAVVSLLEVLRISHPGEDNTNEAIYMSSIFSFMGAVFIIALVVRIMGGQAFGAFLTFEYVSILILSLVQSTIAFKINSRTLKRTIDNTMVSS